MGRCGAREDEEYRRRPSRESSPWPGCESHRREAPHGRSSYDDFLRMGDERGSPGEEGSRYSHDSIIGGGIRSTSSRHSSTRGDGWLSPCRSGGRDVTTAIADDHVSPPSVAVTEGEARTRARKTRPPTSGRSCSSPRGSRSHRRRCPRAYDRSTRGPPLRRKLLCPDSASRSRTGRSRHRRDSCSRSRRS